MDEYNFMFSWLKTATKEQRHRQEMELFAKKHPVLFMKFHTKSKAIIENQEGSPKYMEAREELTNLISSNREAFQPVLEAIKSTVL